MGTACDCRTHKRSILGPGSEIETSLGNDIVLISVALKVFSSILYSKTYQKKCSSPVGFVRILRPLMSQEVSNGCLHFL